MVEVKRGRTTGTSPLLVTRKQQRYSLLKIVVALLGISMLVLVLRMEDPFPTVRKASLRSHANGGKVSVTGTVITSTSTLTSAGGGGEAGGRSGGDTNAEQQQQQKTDDGGAIEGGDEDADEDENNGPDAGQKEDSEGDGDVDIGVDGGGSGRIYTFELEGLKGGKTGNVVIQTRPDWSPIGVEHFHTLMDSKYYDEARFFRVVKDFIVQFGIAADPAKKNKVVIQDDPVTHTNARGTVTFATSGKNTRTTQLFINTRRDGNKYLDSQGFSPIAEVINGMEFVDEIYDGYGEKPNQGQIQNQGNEYLNRDFPLLSYIRKSYPGQP